MAAADVQSPPPAPMAAEPAPAVPDYLASPNAIFGDADVKWRYGRAPDYSKTRAVWEQGKKMTHEAGSLPQLVENLVKNWEVEASFKPRLEDWRTIDHANYSFAINGGEPQTAEHMLKVGTYNAIIAPNEFYSPENSDFASSHKTFKRMMPTFAWEVLEVYSGPPRVAFRWRHWGEMKNDYVGFNDKGEKITAKAHGGKIDIEGVTVAEVDDKVRLRKVETWFDPMEMFRQIAPHGIVNKQIMNDRVSKSDALDEVLRNDDVKIPEQHNDVAASRPSQETSTTDVDIPKEISGSTGIPADVYVPHQGTKEMVVTEHTRAGGNTDDVNGGGVMNQQTPEMTDIQATSMIIDSVQQEAGAADVSSTDMSTDSAQQIIQTAEVKGADMPIDRAENTAEQTSSNVSDSEGSDKTWEKVEVPKDVPVVTEASEADHPRTMEEAVQPEGGEAVAVAPHAFETRMTHEEMSRITAAECPFLMNRE